MAANTEKSYVVNASLDKICSIVKSSDFASELNIEMKSENIESTYIWYRFHHGVTFTSWGEKITITITPINLTTSSLVIHSECGMPTQVIDWGKNNQNVCNIYEYIERALIKSGAFNATAIAPQPATPAQVHAPAPSYTPPAAPSTAQTTINFCPKCGTKVIAGSIFCNGCGTKLQ